MKKGYINNQIGYQFSTGNNQQQLFVTSKGPPLVENNDHPIIDDINFDSSNLQQGGATSISSRGVSRGFVLLVLLRMNYQVRSLRQSGERGEEKIQIGSFSSETVGEWYTEAKKDLMSDPSFEDSFCSHIAEKGAGHSTRFDPRKPTTFWTSSSQLVSWWKNNVERASKFDVLMRDASYEGSDCTKLRRQVFCDVAIRICTDTRSFFDRQKTKRARIDYDEQPSTITNRSFSCPELPIAFPQRCSSIGALNYGNGGTSTFCSTFSSSINTTNSASLPCDDEDEHTLSYSTVRLGEEYADEYGLDRSTSVASIDTVTTRESASNCSFSSGNNGSKQLAYGCEDLYTEQDYKTCMKRSLAFSDDFTFKDASLYRVVVEAQSFASPRSHPCKQLQPHVGTLPIFEFFSGLDLSRHEQRPVAIKSNFLGGIDHINVYNDTSNRNQELLGNMSSGIDSYDAPAAASDSMDEFDRVLQLKFGDAYFKPINFQPNCSAEFDNGPMSLDDCNDYEDFVIDWNAHSLDDWFSVYEHR